jgi:hypothetical protein
MPFLQLPIFFITCNHYDEVLLVIICIGAVYSDHVTKARLEDLMARTKHGIERNIEHFQKTWRSGKRHWRLGVDLLIEHCYCGCRRFPSGTVVHLTGAKVCEEERVKHLLVWATNSIDSLLYPAETIL